MNVLAIYGNPKSGGFVHGCIDALADRLTERGATVERLHLRDAGIDDCGGCFTCLRTGRCVLDDDVNDICRRMREADGFVIGCSVRNGNVTALYKRFFERFTYPLVFTGDLHGKYVLSVSAVGMMGGRGLTKKLLGLAGSGAYPVDHLFFKTGIPTSQAPADVSDKLSGAADRMLECCRRGWRPGPLWRLGRRIDRAVMTRLLFRKQPDLYANVIARYRERGWMD